MRSSRYSGEQIIGILKEVSGGKSVRQLIRHHKIAEATFYRWRERYAGVEIAEAWQLESWEAYRDVTRLGRKTASCA
jgi:putative transposase